MIARKGEMGNLVLQIASLCRQVLRKEYLPRVQALMPALTDHLTIIDDADQTDTSG
jgi:uncharacterized protein YnzC (UPF0291/DUF896 family)